VASYSSQLVDNDTSPEKLAAMLEFAAALGLDEQGATPAQLRPLLPDHGNYGPMTADYRVRLSERGLARLFQSPDPVDEEGIRTILRRIVISGYCREAVLAPAAWLYASDRVRAIRDKAGPMFTDRFFTPLDDAIRNGELAGTAHFFGLQPEFTDATQRVRQLTDALFRMEASILDGFQRLRGAVQRGAVELNELEKASKKFGDALNSFESFAEAGPANPAPIFAVLDGLIQKVAPGPSRDSALSLKVGAGESARTMLFQMASESNAVLTV